jgi:hypothetical protein
MSPILADVGVPMLVLAFPLAFFLLVPIVVLETWISRSFAQISFRRRIVGVIAANAFSTLLGWPITWVALVMLQIMIGAAEGIPALDTPWRLAASVTLQAPWLMPYPDEYYWMIPTAAIVLMIPAFFATLQFESWVLKYRWPEVSICERKRFVWRANFASYALLVAAGLWGLSDSIKHHVPKEVPPLDTRYKPSYPIAFMTEEVFKEPVSGTFQAAPARNVVMELCAQRRVSNAYSGNVVGRAEPTFTGTFKDVPLRDALYEVAQSARLNFSWDERPDGGKYLRVTE